MKTLAVEFSLHAVMRLAQRGFRNGDAELIMSIGTEVEGGYFVREKDVREIEKRIKSILDRLRRVAGKRLVVENGTVVTGYRPRPKKERKLLKNQ